MTPEQKEAYNTANEALDLIQETVNLALMLGRDEERLQEILLSAACTLDQETLVWLTTISIMREIRARKEERSLVE